MCKVIVIARVPTARVVARPVVLRCRWTCRRVPPRSRLLQRLGPQARVCALYWTVVKYAPSTTRANVHSRRPTLPMDAVPEASLHAFPHLCAVANYRRQQTAMEAPCGPPTYPHERPTRVLRCRVHIVPSYLHAPLRAPPMATSHRGQPTLCTPVLWYKGLSAYRYHMEPSLCTGFPMCRRRRNRRTRWLLSLLCVCVCSYSTLLYPAVSEPPTTWAFGPWSAGNRPPSSPLELAPQPCAKRLLRARLNRCGSTAP